MLAQPHSCQLLLVTVKLQRPLRVRAIQAKQADDLRRGQDHRRGPAVRHEDHGHHAVRERIGMSLGHLLRLPYNGITQAGRTAAEAGCGQRAAPDRPVRALPWSQCHTPFLTGPPGRVLREYDSLPQVKANFQTGLNVTELGEPKGCYGGPERHNARRQIPSRDGHGPNYPFRGHSNSILSLTVEIGFDVTGFAAST